MSEPAAVTTQEAVDGYCEKAMRIASVEQIELASIMELSITGQVLKWARQSNLSRGLSLHKADGWNLKGITATCQLPGTCVEKTHTSMLLVTIREGKERGGICSAALREMLRIVKDQIEERGMVNIVEQRVSNLERSKRENCASRESAEAGRR